MGQLDFHQVPLNVKLRVKRGEHALKRLVGEGKKKGGKKQSKWSRDAGGREEWKEDGNQNSGNQSETAFSAGWILDLPVVTHIVLKLFLS